MAELSSEFGIHPTMNQHLEAGADEASKRVVCAWQKGAGGRRCAEDDRRSAPKDRSVAGRTRIEISMDGRGRCHDNIFVERLRWTVKHERVYLRPAANALEQKRSLAEFFDWYNRRRPHQSLGWQTPDEAYFRKAMPTMARAA
jgi:transposase InsO family protein